VKVCIIHHLETMWQPAMKTIFGVDAFEFAENVAEHLRNSFYDLVILTRFETPQLEGFHYETGLSDFIHKVYDYGYGWRKGEIDGRKGKNWVDGGHHSEVVLLTDWLHDLAAKKVDVDLCGAFEGECIEDMEIALSALGVNYKKLNNLIVG
jgi:hypothetical protein